MKSDVEQQGMFGPPKGGGATTSRAAYNAMPDPVRRKQRRRVWEALRLHGDMTDEQIQIQLRMNGNTERPRRGELEEAGWVVDSGKRRTTRAGLFAIVWHAVE